MMDDYELENINLSFPIGLPGGFFIYDAAENGEIIFADQNVIEMFGCMTMDEFREYTGNCFKGMVYAEDWDRIANDILAQTFNSDKKHDYVRYRIKRKDGEIRYVEDFGHLLHGFDGSSYFYVYIVDVDKDEFHNKSRNSFAEAQIFSMNHTSDRLTGLMNMPTFYETMQELMKNPEYRKDHKLTFIHFDIANFKIINEDFGFERGDDLLCRVAYSLKNEFVGAKTARFSNDHFVVCTDSSDIEERVVRIHNSMLNIMDDFRVELKAGIYELEDSCDEPGIACDHARIACNTVKRRYDKIYGVYDVEFYKRLHLQQFVVNSVDDAVEKGHIKVYYQPIIRVSSGKICGYEALARWIDPTHGFLSPGEFIPTLEESHLIHKVDTCIIAQVCEDMRALMDMGQPVVPVSVNLSRLDFELCNVFDLTEGYRSRYDLPRDLIEIEITESALNDDSSFLQKEVDRFKKAGYHVWIDDFGSGYSSLNSLLNYDFDVLKLDLEFLRTYDRQPRAGQLIKHIVKGAKAMGISPLQEGVETEEHFKFLKDIGCERAQGYFFAKPMAIQESRDFTMKKGLSWE